MEATGLFQKSSPLFDSNLLAIEAAANGQGVVVVPQFSVEADIANGTLVAPLASDVMQPGGWYLVHLEQRAREGDQQVLAVDPKPSVMATRGREGAQPCSLSRTPRHSRQVSSALVLAGRKASEMPDLFVNLHPLVLRLFEHRQGRWREGRVGK